MGGGERVGFVYYVITANSMVAFVATCIVFLVFPEHKTGYKELTPLREASDMEIRRRTL
jgi:hypothetical protein